MAASLRIIDNRHPRIGALTLCSGAIVVHGAWYVSEEIARERRVLGRSEGCFAVAQSSIREVLAALGPGRLIYAGKA
jgi:hypothetical protein